MRNHRLNVLLLLWLAALPVFAEEPVVLKSTGIAPGEPEAVLPSGAVLHVRAGNLQQTVKSLDSLAMSFVRKRPCRPRYKGSCKCRSRVGADRHADPWPASDPDLLGQISGVALDINPSR